MKIAAVFSDNMVLQRNKPIRVFGTCTNRDKIITVSIPELDSSARAVIKDGKWEAVLPPRRELGSCTLTVTCGAVKKIFNNVAIGEVWLAGGQSNMEFELRYDRRGAAALAGCSGENIRYYYTPKCSMANEELAALEKKSCWMLPSPDNSRAWSAAAYYFAKELSRRLGVTVGIIGCNWGGTPASAWMSREYLSYDNRLRPYLDDYDNEIEGKTDEQMIAEYDAYSERQLKWNSATEEYVAAHPNAKWNEVIAECGDNPYPGPLNIKNPLRPGGLYGTMLSHIAPYTLAGVLWYQGEADDCRPHTYEVLLKAMIENWRHDWHDAELPFMIVQLPMFRYEADPDTKSWAYIREAQENVFRTVKNTGLAVALDCGEFNNIHPTDKSQIGHRLYLQAMNVVYGILSDSDTLPPMYESYEVMGNTMIIYLTNCERGLCGTDERCLEGFEIAGADGVYYPAEAKVRIPYIELRSDKVKSPAAARFKWTNYAEVGLFGINELPLPPFRTDK